MKSIKLLLFGLLCFMLSTSALAMGANTKKLKAGMTYPGTGVTIEYVDNNYSCPKNKSLSKQAGLNAKSECGPYDSKTQCKSGKAKPYGPVSYGKPYPREEYGGCAEEVEIDGKIHCTKKQWDPVCAYPASVQCKCL